MLCPGGSRSREHAAARGKQSKVSGGQTKKIGARRVRDFLGKEAGEKKALHKQRRERGQENGVAYGSLGKKGEKISPGITEGGKEGMSKGWKLGGGRE